MFRNFSSVTKVAKINSKAGLYFSIDRRLVVTEKINTKDTEIIFIFLLYHKRADSLTYRDDIELEYLNILCL